MLASDLLKSYVRDHQRHLRVSISRYLLNYINEGHFDPPLDYHDLMSQLYLISGIKSKGPILQNFDYLNPVSICYCLINLSETERKRYEEMLDVPYGISYTMLQHFKEFLSSSELERYQAICDKY